jgi:hypothetical protein
MNVRAILLLLPLALVSACASSETPATPAGNTEDDLKKTAAGVSLSARDDGATFAIEEGKKIVVKLGFGGHSANPRGQWEVTSTTRSIGQPLITVKNPAATDAPGTQIFQWKVGGFTRAGDVHKVTLTSPSPAGRAAKTFTFTAKVIAARPTGAKAGEMCGGIAGVACAADLDCIIGATHPDASGICRKTPVGSGLGEICGGIAGFLCKDGLECKLLGNFPDASGECVNAGVPRPPSGSMCGGIAGLRCPEGFACALSGNHPDASGDCIAESATSTAGLGEMCGGIAGIRCQRGLDCTLAGNFPDASGECVVH